jgi:hypothetical protein
VAFTYKTQANAEGDRADVELYGLKTNQTLGADSYNGETKEIEHDAETKNEKAANEIERETEYTGNDIERTADKVGDGISEGVNDAASAIKDEKLDDKVGPGGETAYMDDEGRFYCINNEGKKVFINVLQLKEKS